MLTEGAKLYKGFPKQRKVRIENASRNCCEQFREAGPLTLNPSKGLKAMTVKKHTPSGAQNSTSARTKNQPAKTSKADAQRAADGLTAARIRAIFADPNTSEHVRVKLRRAVTELAEWMNPHVEETPDFLAQQFEDAAALLHDSPADILFARKAAPFYARAIALAEKHEPKAYKLARLALAAAYPDEKVRTAAAGGHWSGTNDVLDAVMDIASEIDVLFIHPDILAAALPVVIREARRYVAEGEHPGTAKLCRDALARIEKAAKGGG